MPKLMMGSILISLIWLVVMAISATAQTPILDTTGLPLRRGVEYYIKPAVNNNGGGPFTLIDRNGSCPWYVGQENLTSDRGIPVTFSPFVQAENVVMLSKSFEVEFASGGATNCTQWTRKWKVSTETDPLTESRLVVTGGNGTVSNYFHVYQGPEVLNNGSYGLRWCPAEVCPYCRANCGFVDVLVESGKRLLALNDDSAFPVVFQRA
ncbi:Proteinase inhibitor I3, Kunitz legume [Parasponia andersonii]|uniref:Proteinase inhibitor I3, Kunitz legume n=1 Tax=Parasponia andersonii TaxID=3476 RepID=A0A2P5D946_PARAD|nr:Proteinase inhibitor I3, Kunitz legume [Parasponia andersonii]